MSLGATLLIVNPAARHGQTEQLMPAILRLLDGVARYDVSLSDAPCHAKELAAASAGFDTVLAVGGDGTVHEVINGLMERPPDDRPAFGLIPTGSGNDYRRTLGISKDVSTAVRQMATGVSKRVDLGVCNGVYFANSLSIGLDARVTAKAVELKVTTGWSGLLLYLRALMFVLLKQYHGHPVRLSFDGAELVDREMLLIAITNGPTYGGGFFITPDAVPDDGLLDICLIDRVSLPGAFVRLPFVVAGKHRWMRAAHMSRHTSVRLESELPVEGQIDGEVMLESVYEVSIVPNALEVVMPRTGA